MIGRDDQFLKRADYQRAGQFVKVGMVVEKMGEGLIGLNTVKNIGGSVGTTGPL